MRAIIPTVPVPIPRRILREVEISEEMIAQLRMVLTAFPFPLPLAAQAIIDALPATGGVSVAILAPA